MSAIAAQAASAGFIAAVSWAGAMDLVTMKIRNSLVLILLGLFALLAPLAGWSITEIGLSAAVASAMLVGTFTLFAFGWIGGGDAKLAPVVALWLGADNASLYLIYSAIFGGVLTLALLQFRVMLLPAFCLNISWVARLHDRKTGVPYGVAIASAALFVYPSSHWANLI
nr:prepilin peptidase [Microvirga sp. BSC39]